MEEDWDNLILLDACRYDYFSEYTFFEGDLKRVVSRANESWGFMQENFVGEEFHDTVYVTANPYAERLEQDVFYTVENLLDSWDADTGTVLPQDVTEAALEAHKKYPNKRLIVHYMQPHTPHLGQTAEDVDGALDRFGWDGKDAFRDSGQIDSLGDGSGGRSMLALYDDGEISREQLTESYRETLEIVEQHVRELLDGIDGKSVISADHGENLGDSHWGTSLVGHSEPSKECRFVPWLELPYDERKLTNEDPPIGFDYLRDRVVQERLADLGYA